ncbi:uncharacterized protein TrAFT101_008740 [Trichoderma asperellum]|uniref:Uncharacterized protein n=1 Tax=Trichoderma asperellum (strain ATCC 204424 / CBS 433.97 / NBRC 101777) TaxID=1042311 RepID=A0A2T3ZBH9_TRIA4|nr:hypothetical protein M441DRAFT_137707 [Trichoderma asperellum CBS 433.97]PTB42159.1 hypothetical protein M441DRAFT_137707 [Trichoderma asperellum CBS 433.97]UKZ93834.1 hypothetical protein TrAFT101_008740 [Trichoderma asperellum]
MGGKTWSRQEERFFWRTIVPQSPKAVKPSDRVHDWKVCAEIMQQEMGVNARRKYSKLMLFEHYFQNVQTGHKSPCAREFVVEHKRALVEFRRGGEVVSDVVTGKDMLQAQQRIHAVVRSEEAQDDI